MNLYTISLTILMFIAGIGIPMMAAMNAGLGTRLDSPIAAVVILLFVALIASSIILIFSDTPDLKTSLSAPKTYYAGGLLFLLYIFSITIAAPKIGLGNAVLFVLAGQIVSATIIDHYALFSATEIKITPSRVFGLALMIVGVLLARK